ncbi:MAG: glycosyltransferase 2 family protein [Candidatus Binatota bacterium]|nr:glycosyltransferase 2 family protein [Candidatus Binatota bacterium]
MKHAGFIARALVGIGLLALLLHRVGISSLAGLAASPRWVYVWISLVFSVLLVAISCAKWRALLVHGGVRVGFGRLFALYCIGIFFNHFLPSTFGGDVARSVGLGRYTRQMPHAFVTVFLERLTGFVALVGCAWAGLALDPSLVREMPLVAALVLATLGLVGVFVLIALGGLPSAVTRILPSRVAPRIVSFFDALRGFRDLPLIARAMGYSFGFYALAVLNVYYSAQVFGQAPDLAGLAIVVPIVLVVSFVPISVGGLGLAEWAYVVCLGQIGVPAAEAVAVGLVLRAKIMLFGVIGGVLLVSHRWEATDPVPRAEGVA